MSVIAACAFAALTARASQRPECIRLIAGGFANAMRMDLRKEESAEVWMEKLRRQQRKLLDIERDLAICERAAP